MKILLGIIGIALLIILWETLKSGLVMWHEGQHEHGKN